MSSVEHCTYEDQTRKTLRIYRVDSEMVDDVVHARNKQTIEIPVSDVSALKIYTGMIAPMATCYIDVYFKGEISQRCFLICGHPAAKLTQFEAKIAGIPVDSEFKI